MRPLTVLFALAVTMLSAVVVSLLFIILTAAQIEERWNIVVFSEILTLARTVFVIALAHALVLGLPLFLLLRSLRNVGIITCALGGFLVAAVPSGVLALTSMSGLQSASVGGRPTVINGVITLAGWIEYAQTVGFIGLFGTAGGLTFWLVLRWSGQMIGKPSRAEAQSSGLYARSWSMISAAILLSGTIAILPGVVRDNSCHNLFRDGRTSIGPQIHADIELSAEDWPTLRQIFVDFGAAHSLSLRDDEKTQSGKTIWHSLSLCNEAGINIKAADQPWLTRTQAPSAIRGTKFRVYTLKSGSDWQSPTRDLLSRIDVTWPQKTKFRGPNGNIIPLEEALKGRQ